MRLFGEQGLDGPSLDELCARAGYSRGAFYVHFKDRDALIAAVMQRVGRAVLDTLLGAERADQADDVTAITRRFLPALLSGSYPLTRTGGVRPYQLLDACARSAEVRAQYVALIQNSLTRLARSAVESQRRRKLRSDVKPEQVALLLLVIVIGVHTLYDLEVPIDLPGAARALLKLLAA